MRTINILRSKLSDVKIPENESLSEFLLRHAEQHGDRVALVC